MGLTRYLPYWRCLVFWTAFLLLSPSGGLRAENWIPGAENYLALEQGRDCAIYRRLAREAQSDLQVRNHLFSGHVQLLKQKRDELERCAKGKGIGSVGGVGAGGLNFEQRLAEVCPTAYEEWLNPGYRLEMDREDIRSAKHNLELAKEVILHRCGPLPLQVTSRKLY